MADQREKQAPPVEAVGADRRRHARVAVPLKARFLSESGEERPCIVENISAGGAMLRAKFPPAEAESVVLYIDEVGRFEGTVIRSGKHSFAVDYRGRKAKSKRTADSLTLTLHNQRSHPERRNSPRIKQDAPATVRLENGEVQTCSILDISLTGASIEIDPRPPLGAQLTLGKMNAKVVRRHEKGVGVVFSGPAKRMHDAINDTIGDTPDAGDGAKIAGSFGRKGAPA